MLLSGTGQARAPLSWGIGGEGMRSERDNSRDERDIEREREEEINKKN